MAEYLSSPMNPSKSLPVLPLLTVFLCGVLPVLSAADTPQLSVYFIGNSLTMSSTLDRVHGLFAQRGIDLQFGSQLSAGKSLIRHWNYASEPDQKYHCWETSVVGGHTHLPHPNFFSANPEKYRFGRYDTALIKHRWDALVMQPFLSPLGQDLEAITSFIQLAIENKTVQRFYIYQTWPRRGKPARDAAGVDLVSASLDIDYASEWTAQYAFGPERSDWQAAEHCASRDYFAKLLAQIGERFPDLQEPVRLIPAGEVLYALDARIKGGKLPGLKDLAARVPDMVPGAAAGFDASRGVNLLYCDHIHFNPMPHQSGVVGNLISGTTIFTVLSRQNPVGLDASAYGFDMDKDGDLVRAIQQTIWDVVSRNPATGVAP